MLRTIPLYLLHILCYSVPRRSDAVAVSRFIAVDPVGGRGGGNDHYYQVLLRRELHPVDRCVRGRPGARWLSSDDHAEAENIFLAALTLTADGYLESWIGLTDELNEGAFVWVTGEPLIYMNWAPGEPNDY